MTHAKKRRGLALRHMLIGSAVSVFAVFAAAFTMPQFEGLGNNPGGELDGAPEEIFTMVASAGTVDEADIDSYNAKGGTMTISSAAPNRTTLNVRYNITALDELINTPADRWQWAVRYKDNGGEARVIVKLRRYRFSDGQDTVLWKFDSNNFAQNNAWQLRVLDDDPPSFSFDFNNHAYYFDAIIIRNSTAGKPGLAIMAIAGV